MLSIRANARTSNWNTLIRDRDNRLHEGHVVALVLHCIGSWRAEIRLLDHRRARMPQGGRIGDRPERR